MEKIETLLTGLQVSIKMAWKQLNDNSYRTLFVVDADGLLRGSVTDGDIRRWILDDRPLSDPIVSVMNTKPIVAQDSEIEANICGRLLEHRIDCIPVVNAQGKVLRVVFLNEVLRSRKKVTKPTLKLPVVIMAGGRGERLDPFTRVLPKPLIPIGEKPVLELIMEKFWNFGINDFYLTLHYKANMIRAYFQDRQHPFQIRFMEETSPCGTAGALTLFNGQLQSTFMVSNADVLVDADYAEVVKIHHENRNTITAICSLKHFAIPYGVVDLENGGMLKGIREKPEIDHLVLTGLYIVEPSALAFVPKDQVFDMTHLIEKLIINGKKVGVYPIADQGWMDIGELDAYRQTLRKFHAELSEA